MRTSAWPSWNTNSGFPLRTKIAVSDSSWWWLSDTVSGETRVSPIQIFSDPTELLLIAANRRIPAVCAVSDWHRRPWHGVPVCGTTPQCPASPLSSGLGGNHPRYSSPTAKSMAPRIDFTRINYRPPHRAGKRPVEQTVDPVVGQLRFAFVANTPPQAHAGELGGDFLLGCTRHKSPPFNLTSCTSAVRPLR